VLAEAFDARRSGAEQLWVLLVVTASVHPPEVPDERRRSLGDEPAVRQLTVTIETLPQRDRPGTVSVVA
jgi:hypothetical protein